MARPIWNGTISFGLLNVPVQLYSGEHTIDLHLRMLDNRDKKPIRYELVKVDEFAFPSGNTKSYRVAPKELEMATQLLEPMTTQWNADDYKDEFRARVRKIIDAEVARQSGKKVRAAKTEEAEMPEATTNVVDFMELLKRSLSKKGGAERKPSKRAKAAKSARKKSKKAA